MVMTEEAPVAQETEEPEDIWRFYLTYEAVEIPCESLWRLYALLISKGTEHVDISGVDPTKGHATIGVYGPLCENANEIKDAGPHGKYARLSASFQVTKSDLHDPIMGLTKEEKRVFVKTIQKRAKVSAQPLCSALNLQRVA